jgi:hypothetical protein
MQNSSPSAAARNLKTQSLPRKRSGYRLAIVLDGVPERWQMNVLQIRGYRTRAKVDVEGYGPVDSPAIRLTPSQARHLATQITELLGPENSQDVRQRNS